jgi:SAM-dependent methyltransferase
MAKRTAKQETRTPERLKIHYQIEKQLANRLHQASKEQRKTLYTEVYNELFQQVEDHPQLTRKKTAEEQFKETVSDPIKMLRPFLTRDSHFLEVGAGDCALSLYVAQQVRQVYAVDVSDTITNNIEIPDNFKLILSDGCNIPVVENSIDVVYSNQLMEHLHPDDALEQLYNIFNVLKPNGVYLCITPNRLNGPHDISRYFDREATGFHLKEYTVTELKALFQQAGFAKTKLYVGGASHYFQWPVWPTIFCEKILQKLPFNGRKKIATRRLIRGFINVRLIAFKLK